jgi:translation initiation factor IF-2
MAKANGRSATIIGFNVKCSKSLQAQAQAANSRVLIEPVIYRLIETVTEDVEKLLKPIVETRIVGEASVLQVFNITVKGRVTRPVAGCRIGNGSISRNSKVRVLRGKKQVYQGSSPVLFQSGAAECLSGTLESLKHVKTDIDTAIKGSDCGMAFEGFTDFQPGDTVLAYEEYEVKRRL